MRLGLPGQPLPCPCSPPTHPPSRCPASALPLPCPCSPLPPAGGSRTEYYRLTCDLVHNTVAAQRLLQRTVEFPAFDPRFTGKQHTTAWLLADMVDHPVLWGPAQVRAGACVGVGV